MAPITTSKMALAAKLYAAPVQPGHVAVDESLSLPIDLFRALMEAGEEVRASGQHQRLQPESRRLRRHDLAAPKPKALPGPLPKALQDMELHQQVLEPPCLPPPAQLAPQNFQSLEPQASAAPQPELPAPASPVSWSSPCPWAQPCARRARGTDKPTKSGSGWLFSVAARCARFAAALGSPGVSVAADAIAVYLSAMFSVDAEDLV